MGADQPSAIVWRQSDGESFLRRLAARFITFPAIVWTGAAFLVVRSRARRDGVRARGPRCPRFPLRTRYAIWWTLDRLPTTCLERALVLQQWSAAHGFAHDVLVGVPVEGVGERDIHAWVEGDPHVDVATYAVIHRLPLATTSQS